MHLIKDSFHPYTLLYIGEEPSLIFGVTSKEKMTGLYIHIPFCESRCIYCGFYSTTSLKMRDTYVDALCQEMAIRRQQEYADEKVALSTIYLGGGTPSMLHGGHLRQIFKHIQENYTLMDDMEVTMECNPDDVTPAFCDTIRELPINRVSMGAQTFSDERLAFLHRRHRSQQVPLAIERLRAIGIHNVSIDLMFGFPSETLENWEKDIDTALSLGVEHISAYSLMYEEGTPLYRMLEEGKISEIDEEVSLKMYERLVEKLTQAGFEHYEISNFARPGYRSRHNSSYWHEIPYIGLGAAAHSYRRLQKEDGTWDVTRSWNIDNLQAYIHEIQSGNLPSEKETLDLYTRYNDMITTALRTSDGINMQKMRNEFGEELATRLLNEAKPKIERGLMVLEDKKGSPSSLHLKLSQKGIYISDDIMGDFMIV